jgi:hypothetical protein
MDQWIPATDFIAADVVRWTEGVFDNRRRGKALRIGERVIAAEVLHRGDDGWVRLLVRACMITKDEQAGRTIPVFKAGESLRRGVKTLLRGKTERLLWSDESARNAVLGRFENSRFVQREPVE